MSAIMDPFAGAAEYTGQYFRVTGVLVTTTAGLVLDVARPRLPVGAQTIPEALADARRRRPDAEALVGRHSRLTYRALDDQVRRAAAGLAAAGLRPGDRVAGSTANHPELVVAFLAAMHLGAIWVGVNRALTPTEKQYLLHDAGVSVFVGDHQTASEVESLAGALPELHRVVDAEPGDATSAWARLLGSVDPADAPDAAGVDPFGPAAIAYTSGTTGRPKGVVHSQHNLLLVGAVALMHRPEEPEEAVRIGVVLPLTILNLMILGPVSALQLGGCLVCIDRIDPVGLATWIRDERVSSMSAVATMIHDLLTHPDVTPADLATLTRPGSGGGATPESFRQLYRERFGKRLTTGYGLTEAPTAVTVEDPELPPVPDGSGRALPHVSVTVRADDGTVLAPGEVGEVCVGPTDAGIFAGVYTPMLGYWNRPEATAEALRDGILFTGDLGYLTADGDLVITDRKGDLILRGGANVYPAEVERVLHEEPRVAACAVVGLPDERLGERVAAAVVVASGETLTAEELREHCAGSLARYKIPERFLFVDELPRNAMGKVVKRLLVPSFD
jgi:long-chain acyl-CoA synthetase